MFWPSPPELEDFEWDDSEWHEYFTQGQCHSLALSLQDLAGWPIYMLCTHPKNTYMDVHNHEMDRASIDLWCHAVAKHPSGLFVDIEGAHTADELIERWTLYSDLVWMEHLWDADRDLFAGWTQPDLELSDPWAQTIVESIDRVFAHKLGSQDVSTN